MTQPELLSNPTLAFHAGGMLGEAAGANTIADYLDAAVAPYMPTGLISPEAMANIRRIAEVLPGALTDFFGFECPLGTEEATADFLVCARASEGAREVLTGQRPGREIPDALQMHPVWRRILSFAREWASTGSPLYEGIHNMWIEFDVDGRPRPVPLPSVFVGSKMLLPTESSTCPDAMPSHCEWLIGQAWPLLLGSDVDAAERLQIARCVNLLPEGAHIFQAGLMLARASRITRLCVRGVSPQQILAYLKAVGWTGSSEELELTMASLAPLVERIDLDLDVTDRVLPKIGLECYPRPDSSSAERFFRHLAERKLATPKKAEQLNLWRGLAHQRVSPNGWPWELASVSAFLEGRVGSSFIRWPHHVKVVCQPDAPLQAKAYLAVMHLWVSPADLKQWLNGGSSKSC